MEKHSSTQYITGIRGYAAFGIFLVHALIPFIQDTNSLLYRSVLFLKYGVVVFFVISAFTICLSLDRRNSGYFKYLIKRVLRIFPLYIAICLIGLLAGGFVYYLNTFNVQNDVNNLISHITFANLFDIRYRNSILGVEWTIPVEFAFYLIIPFLLIWTRKSKVFQAASLVISLIILIRNITIFPYYPNNPSFLSVWAIENYIFTYLMGINLYLLLDKLTVLRYKRYVSGAALLLLFLFLNFGNLGNEALNIFIATILAVLLIIVCKNRHTVIRAVFENRVAVFFGEISFSFYLVHFMIIQKLFSGASLISTLLLSFVISLIISTSAYYAIEIPYMLLGRLLTKNRAIK